MRAVGQPYRGGYTREEIKARQENNSERKMLIVYLEDHGQDFLEWDIKDGVVVDCRPFQGWVWNGTRVHNTDIKPRQYLIITTPDGLTRQLLYPVERVEEKVGV